MVAKATKLKIGNGLDKDTILGPLTTEKRLEEIETLVETTKKEGAKVLCGGRKPSGFNKGYYYEPTIFDDVKDNFTIMKQEPFGPLVPVLTFKTMDEVIKRANDNDLGLASYVYTNSLEKAHKVSERMETGTCAVNTPAVAFAEVPFGGMKQTGYGREGGSMAIKDYLNVKYTHFGINY
jgi:succinate-semialdehyde dehydrogenase/glutarate-semialdehyde dehydrogenase